MAYDTQVPGAKKKIRFGNNQSSGETTGEICGKNKAIFFSNIE